jgi:hypothetical protein
MFRLRPEALKLKRTTPAGPLAADVLRTRLNKWAEFVPLKLRNNDRKEEDKS